jgi:glycyl-tRNA synthetase beta chain
MPLLACARDGVGPVAGDKGPAFADVNELRDFILDRLRGYYADQGFTAAQFDAIATALSSVGALTTANLPANSIALMSAPTAAAISLFDFDRRLRAIREFAQLPEAEALAAANKRIRNILKKTDEAIPAQVNPQQLEEPTERALNDAVNDAIADTDPMLADRDYVGVLKRLATLRAPVDAFFDGVMVMAEDAELRRNRLALLKRLADRFATVAEVALLA